VSCVFCRIRDKEIPATFVHEDEHCLAFRDLNPQAPHHILVVPKKHIVSLNDVGPDDADMLGALLLAAGKIARAEGLADGGWRAVVNTGKDGGQSVFHIHVHVLGGRALGWPPG